MSNFKYQHHTKTVSLHTTHPASTVTLNHTLLCCSLDNDLMHVVSHFKAEAYDVFTITVSAHFFYSGFSGGSDSKESACNEGDLDSIPESGRSLGEGHG